MVDEEPSADVTGVLKSLVDTVFSGKVTV